MPVFRKSAGRPLALGLAAVLALGACSGGGDEEPTEQGAPETTASTTSTTIDTSVPSPLTGLDVDSATVTRPAVTVKVDGSKDGRPQAGLDQADVVIEERVEGSVTRFLAVFHSKDVDQVGPIRSVRPTDPPLLTPIGGVFTFSGGIPAFVSQANKAGVNTVSEDSDASAFILRSDKRRPYKTYAATEKLRTYAADDAGPPAPMFEFLGEGEAFAPAGVAPATKATLVFGRSTTTVWDWDAAAKVWKRTLNGTAHTVEQGGQLTAANVVVTFVSYKPTNQKDPSGSVVDQATVVGSGEAVILTDGKQVRGTWEKKANDAVTTYKDSAGNPIKLTPGVTWVQLPQTASPLTIV